MEGLPLRGTQSERPSAVKEGGVWAGAASETPLQAGRYVVFPGEVLAVFPFGLHVEAEIVRNLPVCAESVIDPGAVQVGTHVRHPG